MKELIQLVDATTLISWIETVGAIALIMLLWKFLIAPVIYIIIQLKGD